ncbi:ferrochelatase [Derxia lacustris]|uniref:ferrochelatase n=1 Tax=Derxia lacustris TaxID=764842 RepID=UPI000A16E8C2|nr:ferrochelatase [Derxia lacustris]
MRFLDDTTTRHGQPARSAVLLVNLGTPAAPTAAAVRPYLAQFLGDPRVVEIPKAIWNLILYGVILPVRARKSAAKYASIWTPDGSPLRIHTERQATLLRGWLGERGLDVEVAWAMRYGEPSIEKTLLDLRARGVERLLVLPLYPQYSASTTATAVDEVCRLQQRLRNQFELRFIKHYHDHPAYIEALAARLRTHFEQSGMPDKLVMSFHGVPKRTLLKGDPYHCECLKTARLVAERLGLAKERWLVTFQSRFGKAEWLQPYTAPTLEKLAREGVQRVDLFCPGFTSDCLETLEEIALEGRQTFLGAGGREFNYIDCLNDRPEWIDALAAIVEDHGAGWLPRLTDRPQRERAAGLTRELARAAGAERLAD